MSEAQGAESAPEAPAETAAPEAPQAPAPDYDRIYSRMDEMAAQQQQLATQFGELFEPAEEEPEPVEYYDDEGQYTDEGMRAVLQDAIKEGIEAHMAPIEAKRLISDRDDAWEALKADYPDLDSNRQLAADVIQQAVEWCNSVDPKLIERPEFVDVVERIYKAHLYDERVAQEQPEPRVQLEAAAGAAQDTKSPQVDWQQRVIDAAKKAHPPI